MIRLLIRNPDPGPRDYASLACFALLYGALLALAAAPVAVARLFDASTPPAVAAEAAP